MSERQRLLALLEVYDTAIEELYVLGDRGFVDLILRLERPPRRRCPTRGPRRCFGLTSRRSGNRAGAALSEHTLIAVCSGSATPKLL